MFPLTDLDTVRQLADDRHRAYRPLPRGRFLRRRRKSATTDAATDTRS